MKKNFSLISSMSTILILFLTLVISVAYAWYTNNKETNATGIASTASDSISILNQGIYKNVIGDDPFPENDKKNEVSGVLSGDVIYYSVSIELSEKEDPNKLRDINISILNIDGGEYFVSPSIKVFENPNGEETDEVYEFEGNEYALYDSDGDKYFIISEGDEEYVYYLYESITGEILTRRPQLICPHPNGSPTGTVFEFDGNKYPTYLDGSDKEYFLTFDDAGGEYVNYVYEEVVNGDVVRYNMCDVYTIGIYKVFGLNSEGTYEEIVDNSDNLVLSEIARKTGLDREVNSFNLYDYEAWNPSLYSEIVFTFAIKFDYSEFQGKINTNCVSDKELIFNNVVITDTEREVSE